MNIKVRIWDQLVGALTWNDKRRVAVFEYSPNFVKNGPELAPLLMPLIEGESYEFRTLPFDTFKGLPPMIADSLPDDFGNYILKAWLVKQGKTIEKLAPLERLGYVGKRGMGALEYEPVLAGADFKPTNIDISELVEITRKVFTSEGQQSYSDREDSLLDKILRTGTSAGGARAKAILALDEINQEYKPGDILHGPDHSDWLIKLDGVTNDIHGDPEGYGRIEYAYYKMANDAGINMSESKLLTEGNRAHFITRRFDRTDGEKVHMQTLSGLAGFDYRLPGSYSYEQVFTVLRKMRLLHNDFVEQFRRMVFNVVARNQDDHAKNISFLMHKNGHWALSPAYDVSYSYNPAGIWTSQHQLSINGKRDNFEINDLLKIGEENNISSRKAIIQQVIDAVSKWEVFAKQANVLPQQIDQIKSTHRLFVKGHNTGNKNLVSLS
ncbi:type II toxin-antitoxin system HipA family toxin [Prolixibacter sp. SD074]|uniref:type II toxin-antitoxin system HipA family toxin n=1 Tax=Prolixibacter sp. SD074 TaxID=2652391 RepID=UPI00126ED264|nr:type II toxin-antitoxin system HipA family toxin [Prolixibacter sp. SD074]GET29409.1 toxin HipA [Prolixibacter sp. SD074]